MHQTIDPCLRSGRPSGGARATAAFAYALIFALCFTLCLTLARNPASDLSIHIAWASEASLLAPKTLTNHVAHPLWHTLTLLVAATGLSLPLSASLVTAACKTVEVALIRRLFAASLRGRASEGAITGAALVVALVSAVCLPCYNPDVYLAQNGLCVGTPNTWHNPTQLMVMAFMLAGVCATARCWRLFEEQRALRGDRATIRWRDALSLSALLALSLLAKPTFMQAFLPAACLFFGIAWLRNRRSSRFFGQMLLAAAPSILMMLLQAVFYFGFAGVERATGMGVSITLSKARDVLISFGMMRAFPLFVLAAFARRDALRDPLIRLTLLFDAFAVLEALVLTETGQRAADGNFGWAQMGSALMLWAIGFILYAEQCAAWRARRSAAPAPAADTSRRGTIPIAVASALLLWHFASGLWYILRLYTSGAAL